MQFEEKTLSKECIYKGKIIEVEKHKVTLPNDATAFREVVKHPGAVAICALTPQREVILVKQYRKAMEQVLLEIPAGKLEPGEDRVEAAMRELEEETGFKAKNITLIGEVYGSPGFSDEKISIYFTDMLEQGTEKLDDDEFVEKVFYSIEAVEKAIRSHHIEDAKTLIAFQYLLLHYNHSK
ncbi:NUDIX hydrolase [Staphylococcus lutrae]|uniref:ADP-ribose pyrophosphatase n=1 Tax=Staphylococcus lutrae TaxID=155085 RepID=A0AAC9RVM3_9STAP|nr:NUDIX hydrolase [Staphylococcus lutrae]ARJ51905.1 ADP-ribose pyrophosphatase [Staphylococcus lutrae]PNZ34073.1 NUDIX hydrolase [Staphylococcus lutrae]